MEQYNDVLIESAIKLDKILGGKTEALNFATRIIEDYKDRNAVVGILQMIGRAANVQDIKNESKKAAHALNMALINYYGYTTLHDICNTKEIGYQEKEKSLSELLDELNMLVGLEKVKAKVNDLIIYQKVQKMRRDQGLHTAKGTLHLAFTGNPGTGKTTVARIVGRIYKQLGLLSKGHFIEVSRTDLIAGYQGQTALKVKRVIESAKGGVLFIDEAYSITENDHSDSYGRECLTELTKALEDYRDDLVVIVAGYTEPMRKFFESNPGLRSRFNTFIEFDDYTVQELVSILDLMCKHNDYFLSEKAKITSRAYFEKLIDSNPENFANGRLVRNLYDDLVMNQARRVIRIKQPDCKVLSEITDLDFCENVK